MATNRDPRVRMSDAYQMKGRTLRRPQHVFSLKMRPYQLQPFCIAPVLPGETMKNLLTQARVVTDPLDPLVKLVGWWCEHYYFYVKHRDLAEGAVRSAVTEMVNDPTPDLTPLRTGAKAWTYAYAGGVDWLLQCVIRIVEEYFRDEGENYDTYSIDGVPQVAIYGRGRKDWTEKLTLAADKRTDESGYDLMGGGTTLQPREFMDRLAHWQTLREDGLSDMDYEDFIRTYGSVTREDEDSPNLHRPELLYYNREFQYPVNVVEPTTGVPASAVAWSLQTRADKDYRFNEPGFIVGLMCCRPKVYFGNQEGTATGLLDDVYGWLPAVLQQDYERAYKLVDDTAGPLGATMGTDYWVDLRDLYLGGEQFMNYAPTGQVGTVALPAATAQRRYAAVADINNLFKDDAANKILVDGVAHFGIAGRQTRTVQGTRI